MNIRDENYETVLDRICIRCRIHNKFESITLKQSLKYQPELKRWLRLYTERCKAPYIDATPEIDLTEKELIGIIKWLDESGCAPARLKFKNNEHRR